MIFYELFKKYEIEITYMFYGFCLAFLGYFIVTIPAPVGSALGLLCALPIILHLKKLDYTEYVWMIYIGWIGGLILCKLFSPAVIFLPFKLMLTGSILGGIVNGVMWSDILTDFKQLIILISSFIPLLNISALAAYALLAKIDVYLWLCYVITYILFFSFSYFIIKATKNLLK